MTPVRDLFVDFHSLNYRTGYHSKVNRTIQHIETPSTHVLQKINIFNSALR